MFRIASEQIFEQQAREGAVALLKAALGLTKQGLDIGRISLENLLIQVCRFAEGALLEKGFGRWRILSR
jgi:hypothetical protein